MRKSGFTLVELSIALVIIGLLIGGILIGQSLIETAKIDSQIQQFQQIDIATQTFKSKYKQLPGDCSFCSGGGNGRPVGNNDGFVGSSTATQCDWYSVNGGKECNSFFGHLALLGFLKNGNEWAYTNLPTTTGPSKNWVYGGDGTGYSNSYPKTILGAKNSYIRVSQSAGNPLFYGIFTTSDFGFVGKKLTPAQTQALDSKMDDGVANTGELASVCDITTPGTYYAMPPCTTAGNSCVSSTDASQYRLSNSSQACDMQLKFHIN